MRTYRINLYVIGNFKDVCMDDGTASYFFEMECTKKRANEIAKFMLKKYEEMLSILGTCEKSFYTVQDTSKFVDL